MDSTAEDGIQTVVSAINEAGEDFRILAQGTNTPEELLGTLEPPWSEYIREHEPWNRAFVIWYDGEPARVATNVRDQWSVTPAPSNGIVDRANVYAELGKGERGLVPGLTYEPAGEESVGIRLELHPVEGREDLFRTVATDGSPIPDIKFQVWDFEIDQPAIDAYRHFDRGDGVRVLETGEEGEVRGTNGRTVTLDLPSRDEDFPAFYPDELEQVKETEDETEETAAD
jgi:hypothetical protein